MASDQGWKSKEAAQRFKQVADLVIPGRQDVLSLISRLVADFTSDRPNILDLGCGQGDLAVQVLELSPDVTITLVDYSDEMLRMASDRFSSSGNIRMIKHDLNSGIPADVASIDYDVIVSSFTLHHVDYDKRVGLYTQINRVLKEGGLFINGDRFKEEAPDMDAWIFDDWIRWMMPGSKERFGQEIGFDAMKQRHIEVEQKFGDMPGTVWEMERDLRQAGFEYVDCLYKNRVVAVIAAQK